MVNMSNKLIAQIQKNEIDVDDALKLFEDTATHIFDVSLDIKVEPLKCGFPTIEKYKFIRANKPDLIVMAARPGMGKTSFVLQLGNNIAKDGAALIFSLEMTKEQLKNKLIALETNKSLNKLAQLSDKQLGEINDLLRNRSLYIDDTNNLDIDTLVQRALTIHAKHKLNLVIVDYLQIVSVDQGRSKAEEVAIITRKLKNLAKQLNVPVMVLAQMNRNVESRLFIEKNTKPMMSDLGDSSAIEKWADVIMFLHRQYIYDRTRPGEADIFVAKNRHGESRDFIMQFSGEITKFFDEGEGV